MSSTVEEMKSYIGSAEMTDEEFFEHYGTPRHSGRYPWGSGKEPYQHSADFLARIDSLKKSGLSETQIAETMGLSTTQLRAQKSLAKNERRMLDVARAKSLRSDGLSLNEIAREMGFKNDSSVRSLLNENAEKNMTKAMKTANVLREIVDEKGMVDIGTGVELELGISKEKLKEAVTILEREGYVQYGRGVSQATNPGKQTNVKILCKPGTEHKDIYDTDKIHSLKEYSFNNEDNPDKIYQLERPKSLDSKRLTIRYAEDGGKDLDGVIELRRGKEDISLGDSKYAQVRIMVDGTHYLKGMAVYADDLPDGVDVRFNTNKTKDKPMTEVLKKIKDDPDNPFGALIKANGQRHYIDENGKEQLSVINKTREEGDWTKWSKNLPSQFLGKQSEKLIRTQLNLTTADKKAEYAEICALTNPTVKKNLLKSFADDCDAAAVHLKAAALPRQGYKVILPVPSLKDNEIYAPTYRHGETVALVRFPHGGTFEIPVLKVNNKHADAIKRMGNAFDAVGINAKVAERLSGADFDGDTVMVIPCNSSQSKVKITSTPELPGLKGFDPKDAYPAKEGMRVMRNTQTEMGKISNLITDMTLKGATDEELARAVRHSMVVIDAEKHKLNYKQSELDNGIASLKKKYQGTIEADGRYHEGAGTLLSRAKSETQVLKRKGSPRINEDGSLSYKEVREEYTDKNGKVQVRTQKSTKMAEAKDARELSSGTRQEELYAAYANSMKSLANQARKEMMSTGKIEYSKEAKEKYLSEVKSLDAKLQVSLKNAPRERAAQIATNAKIDAMKKDNPDMSKEDIKKAGQRVLVENRNKFGARRQLVDITPKEWEAIQAGAISENKLSSILNHADPAVVRQYATPRTMKEITPAKASKMKSMLASGYTIAEIADAIGVSASTVSKHLK